MNKLSLGLVIVAAGSARRMSGVDKVWSDLGGHPVVWHSLARLSHLARQTILVVKGEDVSRARAELARELPELIVVPGGAERQFSVREGLSELSAEVAAIAVHDAARPFADTELLEIGYRALSQAQGAVPAIEVPDTIKRVDSSGTVVETLDRFSLRAVQTPQLFQLAALQSAHDTARTSGTLATDDAGLLEHAGYRVVTFSGSPTNLKITSLRDLQVARAMLERGEV